MELETRELQIRSVNTDERTFTGIAVPWDTPTQIGDYYSEQFARGSIGDVSNTKIFYGHTEVIGRLTGGRETDEGFEVTGYISDTQRGNDTRTMMRDGTLDRLSVGFIPVEHTVDEETGTVTRTKVDLREVSVVPFPAYDGAKISEVRADTTANNSNKEGSYEPTNNMDNEVYDDSEIRSEIEIVKRELAVVRDGGITTNNHGTNFRSGGEFLKALHANDESAKSEVRAFTGAVLADSHTSADWKNDLLVIVNKGRPLVNLFGRGPLGDHGMTVSFPKVDAVSGDVAVQAAEGDDLTYIELTVTTGSADVKTYGGYSELSRQAIERSDVSYLDAVLRAQAASYAKVTNTAVRTAVTGATPQTGTSFTLSSADTEDFLTAVIDGISKIDANTQGLVADFVLVSADVWAKMASLVDSANRPVFGINGDGSNTIGNVNVRGTTGTIAGLPIVVDSGLAAKTFYVASADAVSTWENSGAPVRLNDENIINLSKQFSLYGYLAVGVKQATGLVKATVS